MTVASIKGGEVPLDPRSLQEENLTEHSKSFLNSGESNYGLLQNLFNNKF